MENLLENKLNNNSVLYFGGFELPDKNAAAHRVIANSKILRDLGYDVTLFGIFKGRKIKGFSKNQKYFDGFTYYEKSYPKNYLEWFFYLFKVPELKEIQYYKPAFIIVYNFSAFGLFRIKNYCRRNKIFVIADCTEWYSVEGNLIYRAIKGLDTILRMRVIHKKLDGIIVISRYLEKYYLKSNIPILYVPPLIDKEDAKWKGNESNEDDKNYIKFIYAGSPGKGSKDRLDLIINSFRETQSILRLKLFVIGITEKDYFNLFGENNFIESQGNSIIFCGRLSHQETLASIRKSDFSIIIRDRNLINMAGFPTKFVESIACGTPVLTNLFSDIHEFFWPGKTGFIIDETKDGSIHENIEKILELDYKEISEMKDFCINYNAFDYRNYRNSFLMFINKFSVY